MGVVINITGSMDMGLAEVEQAATLVQEAVHPEANTIFGATFDETMEDEIRVTVIATGFVDEGKAEKQPAAEAAAAAKKAETAKDSPIADLVAKHAKEESEDDKSFQEILNIFNRGEKF